jgi:flagellar motor protein MotB
VRGKYSFSYNDKKPIFAHMRIGIFILFISFLGSCVSSKKYASSQSAVTRLQADSALLEKRIHGLQDQVNYLATKNATTEQTLTQRLQEKQDSLDQKQQELSAKENNINDMKARKVQEQEAFGKLYNGIIKSFAAYGSNEVNCRASCTQVIVEISDRLLFMPNTSKLNIDKTNKVAVNIADILNKQPDLKVLIVNNTDSVYAGKEKWDDNWSLGSAKANALARVLIKDFHVAPQRLMPATQAEFIDLTKANAALGKSRTAFLFYSELLPCVHNVE